MIIQPIKKDTYFHLQRDEWPTYDQPPESLILLDPDFFFSFFFFFHGIVNLSFSLPFYKAKML